MANDWSQRLNETQFHSGYPVAPDTIRVRLMSAIGRLLGVRFKVDGVPLGAARRSPATPQVVSPRRPAACESEHPSPR